jgi:hypothetical protein
MTDKYYNTNREEGETLKQSRKMVASQEEQVTEVFQRNSHRDFTRYELHQAHFPAWETSSITRAMNNLMKTNVIDKLDKMRMGGKGKMQHCWALRARVDTMRRAAPAKEPAEEKATKQRQLTLF